MEKQNVCDIHRRIEICFIQWNNDEGFYSMKIFGEFYSLFPKKYGPKIIFRTIQI